MHRVVETRRPSGRKLPVTRISFEGVSGEKLASLRGTCRRLKALPWIRGRSRIRCARLYANGLFDSAEALGQPEGAGVALIFRGTPRFFIGTVTVEGARGATVNTQLERAGRLNPGTRFTQAKMATAVDVMHEVLARTAILSQELPTI